MNFSTIWSISSRVRSKSHSQGISGRRTQLAERLRARAPEICRAILDRLHAMEEDKPVRDSEYLQGLRIATSQGVAHAIEVLAVEEGRASQVPIAFITQARLASRLEVPLDLAIRRYLAAKDLLGDFMLEEAAAIDALDAHELRSATAALGTAFDQVLATVTEEYRRETRVLSSSPSRQLTDRVRRLLAGELVDRSSLDYDLECHHLGLVARSEDARPWLRLLASRANSRCLIVSPAPGELWAWLGTQEPLDPGVIHRCPVELPASIPIGIGEPDTGPDGWRLTHRQARAAVTAASTEKGIARYGDVALLVAAGQDPLLMNSLVSMYLSRLAQGRDQGAVLRNTLRAYFAADRNRSSAAAALGVSRQTVANRLKTVEERLAQPLSDCATLLQTALRLEELRSKASS